MEWLSTSRNPSFRLHEAYTQLPGHTHHLKPTGSRDETRRIEVKPVAFDDIEYTEQSCCTVNQITLELTRTHAETTTITRIRFDSQSNNPHLGLLDAILPNPPTDTVVLDANHWATINEIIDSATSSNTPPSPGRR